MLEEENVTDEIEVREKTLVYVLKYLEKIYSDFEYDDDTIGIWMESLENVPNDAMIKSVKEWCKLNSRKLILADFRKLAITKPPDSAIKKEEEFELYKEKKGRFFSAKRKNNTPPISSLQGSSISRM